MDRSAIRDRISTLFKKYRYALLILLVGIIFMLIPQKKETQSQEPAQTEQAPAAERDLQTSLEDILSRIEGAGRVEVLLTQAAGEEVIFQNDSDNSVSESGSDSGTKTVIVTDENRAEQPIVRQVMPPTYLGAVIVCQGGDSPAVQLAIVEAVSSATGLTADRITVLKMK